MLTGLMPTCRGAFVAAPSGIPIVATVHGKNYFMRNLGGVWLIAGSVAMRPWFAVSENLKEFIVERVKISRDRIKVVL